VLGLTGSQASRYAAALQHKSQRDGRRRHVPGPRFGIEREEKLPDGTTRKVSLLADGSYSKDSEIKDGYPEFTLGA